MSRAEIILSATIHEEIMARHSAASPLAVGIEMAQQVKQAIVQQELDYVPALDYFRQKDSIEEDLLEVYDSLSWLGEQLMQTELRTRLRSVYAQLEEHEIQALSETLPKLKPNDPNLVHQLTEHYTPNRFNAHLRGILTPRMKDTPIEGAVLFALRDSFEQLVCVHSQLLE